MTRAKLWIFVIGVLQGIEMNYFSLDRNITPVSLFIYFSIYTFQNCTMDLVWHRNYLRETKYFFFTPEIPYSTVTDYCENYGISTLSYLSERVQYRPCNYLQKRVIKSRRTLTRRSSMNHSPFNYSVTLKHDVDHGYPPWTTKILTSTKDIT